MLKPQSWSSPPPPPSVAAAGPAPSGTCAVATPTRRPQSPPPPPPGSAVTSCSCFPVGRVGLTFDSQPSAVEGARRPQAEKVAPNRGGVEPGRAGRAGLAAAGVPDGRGAETAGASRGFRFEDSTSYRLLDYAHSFPTQ
ncbi:Hypothetical predicted protein [Marmota monax]|uniref:Uncharacterized protein n=1 Tax=Marmota monax TaxID=9995 RepID=A0A5E4C9D1_MARMO|nr:hypothetical protein GHT09_009459 [Marmota monax]VTJ77551.1 Hypothetical predicted protein [Marmota monax]